jgi:hypothetical protein
MIKLLSIAPLVVAMMTLNHVAIAQTGGNREATHDNIIITQGSTAKLALQTRLSSKLNEVGDEVIATLYEPLRDGDGRIAIQRGVEFIGRVTQVQAAKRPQREATMTVVFETMRMSYGVEKVVTIVTAIDDYANDNKMKSKDGEGKVGGGHSGERTAKNAGIGGGLGSIGGVIISH